MLLTTFLSFGVFFLVSRSYGLLLEDRQVSYDVVHSGRYTIVNCGSHNATRLGDLLETLRTMLQPSIQDASLATRSAAFRTFFKSAANSPAVTQLLANATTGVSLFPPARRRFDQSGSPSFLCVTAAGQLTSNRDGIDYYDQCVRNPSTSMISVTGTPYTVLCPLFFASAVPDLPPADDCLPVVDDGAAHRFRTSGYGVVRYRVFLLLEGILRYYLYATTGSADSLATDVNRCVSLGTVQVVKNPMNYLYYVASVHGQCVDFPDMTVPRRRPLENSTASDRMGLDDGTGSLNATDLTALNQPVMVDPSSSVDSPST